MMKKIILAAIASTVFAIGAMAQYRPSVIVSAGYQGANISGFNDSKIASGARAGVALDFGVLNTGGMELSVQPGLNFSMKGFSYGEKESYKNSLYYVDLPILANLRFGVTDGLNAFVNAGPYLAYGVGGSAKYDDKTEKTNPFKETTIAGKSFRAFNPFDWGLQVGAGLEYQRVMLSVGAQFGLYDVTQNHTFDFPIFGQKTFGETNKNSAFFVTAGYRF